MARDRSPYGFLASALGAVVLGLGVFLPWYGVGITAQGVAALESRDNQVVAQFGNAALQQQLSGLHAELSSIAGSQLGSISAHQAFSRLGPLLLIVAGLGIVISLTSVARERPSEFDATGGWVALLGAVALVCVLYRMLARPVGEQPFLTLSLRDGAWLALLGAVAMIAGGLWPRRVHAAQASPEQLEDVWSTLSGWTPEA
jgi:drug/metabolite transporter superfamily protein YnfA